MKKGAARGGGGGRTDGRTGSSGGDVGSGVSDKRLRRVGSSSPPPPIASLDSLGKAVRERETRTDRMSNIRHHQIMKA